MNQATTKPGGEGARNDTPLMSLRGALATKQSHVPRIATPEPALSSEILPLHYIQGFGSPQRHMKRGAPPSVIARNPERSEG